MGCGCRGSKPNSKPNNTSNKTGLDRYAFLTPAQLQIKRQEDAEKKRKLEESTRNGGK